MKQGVKWARSGLKDGTMEVGVARGLSQERGTFEAQ